ncbi:DMT family transporter [Flammeovirga sp. EKP202]|uniref:DMT family transporter n=1 Tax=Flammeovirga sp. EKP202 TaxID=2770592 RepID=UPI00165FF7A4|nr:DMT family transporter [Flammeovirga sp. EKP202]MBD0405075.1 EamA family transporter [Flammeovirga sp. EKP202]
MNKLTKLHAHLFLMGASIIYGCNFVISKLAMPAYITPYAFIFLRITGGAILFNILHQLTVKDRRIDKKDIPRFLLAALCGACINQLLFFDGLSQTSPINASVIVVSVPIVVLTLSFTILKESITPLKIIGITLGFMGSLMMIGLNGIAFHSGSMVGDLKVFLNAVLYSFYLIITKPLLVKYHPNTVMMWVFTMAVPFVIIASWSDVQSTNWEAIPLPIYAAIAYPVLFTTLIANLFYAIAMRVVNASTASFYIYFQPMVATVVAIIVLGESLKGVQVIAAVLIFAGVYLIGKKKK